MIDHFNLPVTDLGRSRRFYVEILAPLGYAFLMQDGDAIGFGADSWRFGLIATPPPFPTLHVAFQAPSRAAVHQFFEIALTVGGRPNGEPALRPHYHPDYYAAFVLDPDGHNLEAVHRG